MSSFVEFLKEYWFQLATGLFFIVEVVLLVIKRKPKSIDDFKLVLEEVLAVVPELVISRERPGEGSTKKLEVITSCISLISSKLGRKLTDSEKGLITAQVAAKIETVLSTPTKKENLNEK